MERNFKPFSEVKVGDTIYRGQISEEFKEMPLTDEQICAIRLARGGESNTIIVYHRNEDAEYIVNEINKSIKGVTRFVIKPVNPAEYSTILNITDKNLSTHNVSYVRTYRASNIFCTTKEELEFGVRNVLEGLRLYESIRMNEKISSISNIQHS